MENKPVHILCTRPVNDALITQASSLGFVVDVKEFIDTVAIKDDFLAKQVIELGKQSLVVIFTSMNAVTAVTDSLQGEKPAWMIYCMGNTTRELVVSYFGANALIATGVNAINLAQSVVSNARKQTNSLKHVFFCGDQRRDELPGILRQQEIELEEVIVYKTIETSQELKTNYDAVLFFSPSAVHSFFKKNNVPAKTILYAIGETTAQAIQSYTANKIMIAETPSKDELFLLCIEQLSQEQNSGKHQEIPVKP